MASIVKVQTDKSFVAQHVLTTNLGKLRDLTQNQKLMLILLVSWGSKFRISNEVFASIVGVSLNTIQKDSKVLVDKGYVTRTRPSRHTPYTYEISKALTENLDTESQAFASVHAVCKIQDIPVPAKDPQELGIQTPNSCVSRPPKVGYPDPQELGDLKSIKTVSKELNKSIGHSPDSQATADTIDQQTNPVVQGKETDEDHMQSKDVIANLNQGKSNLKKSKGKARHGTRKNTRAAATLALKTLASILKDKDPSKAQPTINDMHMNKLANLANKLGKGGKPNWVGLVKLIAFSCRHWEDYCNAANKIYKYNPNPNLVSMTTYMALDAMEIVAKKRYTEFSTYTHTLDDGAVSTTVCTADELEHKPVTKMGKAPSKAATKKPVAKHEEPEIVCDDDDDYEPDKWDLAIAEIDAKTKKSN